MSNADRAEVGATFFYTPVGLGPRGEVDIDRYVDAVVRLNDFWESYLTHEHFERIVVWHTEMLPNARAYGLNPRSGGSSAVQFACIADVVQLKDALLRSSLSGHFSVWFGARNATLLRGKLLGKDYYAVTEVPLPESPVSDHSLMKDVEDFLRRHGSHLRHSESAFAFAHDAAELVEARFV